MTAKETGVLDLDTTHSQHCIHRVKEEGMRSAVVDNWKFEEYRYHLSVTEDGADSSLTMCIIISNASRGSQFMQSRSSTFVESC